MSADQDREGNVHYHKESGVAFIGGRTDPRLSALFRRNLILFADVRIPRFPDPPIPNQCNQCE
jgi:hypothetical protein